MEALVMGHINISYMMDLPVLARLHVIRLHQGKDKTFAFRSLIHWYCDIRRSITSTSLIGILYLSGWWSAGLIWVTQHTTAKNRIKDIFNNLATKRLGWNKKRERNEKGKKVIITIIKRGYRNRRKKKKKKCE